MKLQSLPKFLAIATVNATPTLTQAQDPTPAEVRAIAKEAYIYG